jgi:hypothetical protein
MLPWFGALVGLARQLVEVRADLLRRIVGPFGSLAPP